MEKRLHWSLIERIVAHIPRWILVVGVFLFGLGITALSWDSSSRHIREQAQAQFSRQSDGVLARVHEVLGDYLSTLKGTTGLFASSRSVEHHEWKQYVDQLSLTDSFPGVRAVGFIHHVLSEQLVQEIAEMRFFAPDLQLSPGSSTQTDYALLKYVIPEKQFNQLLGRDVTSEPEILSALDLARDEMKPVLVPAGQMFSSIDPETTWLMAFPIFKNGGHRETLEARKKSLDGWVILLLNSAEMFREIFSQFESSLVIRIEGDAQNLVYASSNETSSSDLVNVFPILFGASKWTATVGSKPFTSDSVKERAPTLIVVFGTLVSVLLSGIIFAITRTEERALELAKKMTAAMRESEERFRNMATSAPLMLWTATPDLHWDYVNKSWTEFTGQKLEESLGLNWEKRIHPSDLERVKLAFHEAVEHQSEFRSEFYLNRCDGVYRWIISRAAPRFLPDGSFIGYVGTCLDITERKQAEEELKRAKEDAEDTSKMKGDFLEAMSHKARTVMANIVGFSDFVIEDSNVNEHLRNDLVAVQDSALQLDSVLRDVLDFVRVEAGQLPVTQVRFTLSECLKSISQLVELEAGKREQQVLIHVASDVPAQLVGDPVRLRQVLITLLANSVKFTPDEGAIMLYVRMTSRTDSTGVLMFSVTDSGVGIAKSKQSFLFESFSQASEVGIREAGGTGLGLSIARRLVKELAGALKVESSEGVGTAIHVEIPFEFEAQSTSENISEKKRETSELSFLGDRINVLVAEDNPVNSRLLVRILEKVGCSVRTATNGAEVLRVLEQTSIDVVLMDIEMPEIGGLDAARKIRESKQSYANVPILGVTAHVSQDVERQCQAAGMDGFVRKPVRREELLKAIQNLLLRTA